MLSSIGLLPVLASIGSNLTLETTVDSLSTEGTELDPIVGPQSSVPSVERERLSALYIGYGYHHYIATLFCSLIPRLSWGRRKRAW